VFAGASESIIERVEREICGANGFGFGASGRSTPLPLFFVRAIIYLTQENVPEQDVPRKEEGV
jgi:hypothetical protein